MTEYLDARRLIGTVRAMMAVILASWIVCLIALLTAAGGPSDSIPVVMTWTAVGGGVACLLLWLWRWPSHSQSVAFVLVTNTSIALACLAYPNPHGALTGCISFATVAAYIAFFQSTALVLYNFAVAAWVGVIAAIRLAASGQVALAAVDLFLVLQINIAMPVAIHVLVRALGVDLVQSSRDPLTGLLNRRAFNQQAAKLLLTGPHAGRHLAVALIDLDDFKRINDTYGHHVGDQTLVAVARALRRAVVHVPAVVGRCGGEEFVVAAVWEDSDPSPLASRICEAIAAMPEPVTASVGTACVAIGRSGERGDDHLSTLDRLMATADEAMYAAKRAGGNGFRHDDLMSK